MFPATTTVLLTGTTTNAELGRGDALAVVVDEAAALETAPSELLDLVGVGDPVSVGEVVGVRVRVGEVAGVAFAAPPLPRSSAPPGSPLE